MDSKEQFNKLRAAIFQKEEASAPKTLTKKADVVYRHWDVPVGKEATVRFLQDGNPDNDFFWAEKLTIKLPFSGQVGGDYPTTEDVVVTVPCVEMFGKVCPIISHIRPWWNQGDEGKARARVYYKKKSNIFQGFVVNSPFEEENAPENPIRLFTISQSIFEIIYKALKTTDFEDMPTDFTGGRDFKIAKTSQGEYANYSTSSWSFRTRALNENELIAIDQHGLFNLSEQRGFSEPDADGIEAIKAMFLDSLAGKPFDFVSYGSYYRAYGTKDNEGTEDRVVARPAATSASVASEDHDAPAVVATPTASKPQAAEILERIKARTMGKTA